jgi:hypothetical protein
VNRGSKNTVGGAGLNPVPASAIAISTPAGRFDLHFNVKQTLTVGSALQPPTASQSWCVLDRDHRLSEVLFSISRNKRGFWVANAPIAPQRVLLIPDAGTYADSTKAR